MLAHSKSVKLDRPCLKHAYDVRVPMVEIRDVASNQLVTCAAIYDEAGYDLSIDYQDQPPPPPLSADAAAWVRTLRG